MYILLHDASATCVSSRILNQANNLVYLFGYSNAMSPIGIFSRFNNPNVLFIMLIVLIITLESLKFRILQSVFDMESHRQCIERVFTECFIIRSHINKKCFFIRQMVIILHLVVDLQRIGVKLYSLRLFTSSGVGNFLFTFFHLLNSLQE